jgi:phosphate transport system substrate-binding protein
MPRRDRCWRLLANATALLGALQFTACAAPDRPAGDSTSVTSSSGMRVDLTGAGATFPYPLYSRWFNDYAQRTNVRINYQSIGSGGGIRQMIEGTVDFGATDVPMTDAELAQAGSPIVHLPTVLGAVAVTYNLPDLKRPLRLSGDVLADIFLGTLTKWDDPRLQELNPGVSLPHTDILVVHRADGSGTSHIFSDYLAAVSSAWASGPGRGKDVRWPAGLGGRGNEGVAGQVKQMVGSIGYLEVVYARQNHLPVAHIRNQRGRFISPMPYEIASAAASAMEAAGPGSDLRLSLVNAAGDQAYPIASFTWLLLSPTRLGAVKTNQLIDFLRWALVDGGDLASSLGYVALPTVTATHVLDQLDSLSARATTNR